jgi:DNA-binding transcriptional MocR family regulator
MAGPESDGAVPPVLESSVGLAVLPSALEPLRKRNAAEQLAERLVTAIALGEFVPGQRLPAERELSGMLGVSRTVVREALHRLADDGYLEIQRGRNGGGDGPADARPPLGGLRGPARPAPAHRGAHRQDRRRPPHEP